MIEFKNVTKRFLLPNHRYDFALKNLFGFLRQRKAINDDDRYHYALRDISLKIERGERVGIIGDNGAGKSTLLNLITGITKSTHGEVCIDNSVEPMLLQTSLGVQGELNAYENIFMRGLLYGMKKKQIEVITKEIVDFAEIGKYAEQPIKYYSSGMKQRLFFSIFLHVQSEVILLDEALGAGDVHFRVKARKALEKWMDQGRTMVTVSHSLEEVIGTCTRCIYLKKGRLIMDGKPEEVVKFYKEETQ